MVRLCRRSLLLLAGGAVRLRSAERGADSIANIYLDGESASTGVIVRPDGVLLTQWDVLRKAKRVQVRLANGEVFDNPKVIGIDERRNFAALRVTAYHLPTLITASIDRLAPGAQVTAAANVEGVLRWNRAAVVTGIKSSTDFRGAGAGYRMVQFRAPGLEGNTGGILLDNEGRLLGVLAGFVIGNPSLLFAVPVENLMGLADQQVSSIEPSPNAPEQSTVLETMKTQQDLLRTFRTMYVDAGGARYFRSNQMKAALGRNKDFQALNIRIVDDQKLADTVLTVGYTFAWDFPFELKHQNTSTILLAGKGVGPLSGPVGAASVAREFVRAAKPWRAASPRP